MILHIRDIRKDQKLAVTYAYSNGVHMRKIITLAQATEDIKKADYVGGAYGQYVLKLISAQTQASK